jgi:hypothetical protein
MLPALLLTLLTTATADPDANPIAKPKPRPQDPQNEYYYYDGGEEYGDVYYDNEEYRETYNYEDASEDGPSRGDQSLISPPTTPPTTTTTTAYVELEPSYPCADYKPGEDDLQNFDMIRKFQLDVNLDGYPGVTRVRGSNRMQTAYRIDSSANFKNVNYESF